MTRELAESLERVARVRVRSVLAGPDVEAVHLELPDPPPPVLDDWFSRAGPGEQVTFVDDAPLLEVRRGGALVDPR